MHANPFEPDDPLLASDPWTLYARLRDEFPLCEARVGGQPIHVLSRHEDVRQVLNDSASRVRPPGAAAPAVFGDGPAARMWRSAVSMMDPPDHTRVRRIVGAAFTHKRAEAMRPRIGAVVDSVFDAVRGREHIEFVQDIALRIPMRVICDLLGVPESDWAMLEGWTPDFLRIFLPDPSNAAELGRIDAASANFLDYFGGMVDARRRMPRADLVSELAAMLGPELSRDELVGALRGLLTAGFETTAATLSATALCVARTPALLATLRDGIERRTRAAEEMLRWESPVRAQTRRLGNDTEFHGRMLPEGTPVLLLLGAANHDPRRFTAPEAIDFGRAENPHVAFGGGRHLCLGLFLARAELQLALARMANDWESVAIETEAVERRANFQFPSITRLPLAVRYRA